MQIKVSNIIIPKIKPIIKKPMSQPSTALQTLLTQTPTHPKIKQSLKLLTQARQKITYHSMVSSPETYLHLRGLINSDHEEFNYVNKILHSRIVGVLGRVKRKELVVRDLEGEMREQEEERVMREGVVNQEIMAEVEYVINNVDLPLSLFKRNDKYWYHDNPKTVQAKNYVHSRIKQDIQRKNRIKSELIKKQTQKQRQQKQRIERQMKAQEQRRKRYRQQVQNHIQARKKMSQQRQKNIKQSQKYTSSLKPLFLKIHQQQQVTKISALQQQKKRLSQLRKLHKSIDISQIQQHKNKLIQLQKQKQLKRIFNQPLKVSYKSKYHTSMTARSRISEMQSTKSLIEKKKQYGEMVKHQFKPHIDQQLVEQMEERLKLMKRKRVKKNPKKKQERKGSGDDDEDDQQYDDQQQRVQQVKKPETPKNVKQDKDDDDDDDDSEEEQKKKKPPKRIRGEDEDPDRQQRYQLGVQYLEYVRNLRKKKKQQNSENTSKFDGQNTQYSKQNKGKTSQRYKDYLKQFTKTNRSTIDHINTQRMKNQYNKSIINKNADIANLSRLQNETRMVQTKISRQQELLKFKKMKNQQAIAKKVQIDNAVVQTIKARLALMGN